MELLVAALALQLCDSRGDFGVCGGWKCRVRRVGQKLWLRHHDICHGGLQVFCYHYKNHEVNSNPTGHFERNAKIL